jgi:RHS repeat-associated protein
VHTFGYDAAGRQIRKDGATLAFDAADQLLAVTGLPGGAAVTHAYGHDGLRVKTTSPAGVSYWFAAGISQRGDVREHDLVVGDRVVGRVSYQVSGAAAQAAAGGEAGGAAGVVAGALRTAAPLLPLGLGVICLGWAFVGVSRRRGRPVRVLAAATATFVLVSGCSPGAGGGGLGVARASLAWTLRDTVFTHVGIGAGPALFTDAAGRLLEERRYEPFGEELDARIASGAGYTVGAPDLAARDLNSLNKRTEVTTGWSYHGARWMAPETGRWLSVDPPTRAPEGRQLEAPWGLHPYQYVDQNPVRYWDPDGNDKALLFIGMGVHANEEAAALTTQVGTRGTVISIFPDDGKSSKHTEGGTTYDLTKDADRYAFGLAMKPNGFLVGRAYVAGRIASLLKDADAETRNELAQVISVYSRAHRGEIDIERVVISGHHWPPDSDIVYGDSGHKINLSALATLGDLFPKAVTGVKHVAYSACGSMTGDASIETTQGMFHNVKTIWGYGGSSPFSPTTRGGAIDHLKVWDKATSVADPKLKGDEAKGYNGAGNVRVKNL